MGSHDQADLTLRFFLSDLRSGHLDRARPRRSAPPVPAYAVVDESQPARRRDRRAFLRREDAERFIEEVRGDEPKLAKSLRIEERELIAGEMN
jgi:hypothetical protein